ncbi:MAG: HIT family hydrolase [Euryarchaeota archaeon]|nr:HIT family hydrolase [Euryarchaeota archaeon]
MGEPSLFDLILNGTVPSHKVAEGEHWYAFLDIFPRREGHTLVIPKQSVQRMLELTPQSRDALFDGVVQVQSVLSKHFNTQDFTVCVHDGPLAGQEIPHVHVHILPRHSGDGGGTLHSMWPLAEPHGGDVDHGQLAELSQRLQGVEQ